MTFHSLIHDRPEIQRSPAEDRRPLTPARLQLLPDGDGWSLVGLDGRLVYTALDAEGRQRCLRFAQHEGVLTLTS